MEIADYIILSDQQLVLLARSGDGAAFEALVTRYRASLRQLFTARNVSGEDADDILQEAFIKIFLRLESYNPDYTFGQWAYTIARNTLIDYYRNHAAQPHYDLSSTSTTDPSANPEQRVIDHQNNELLMHRMEQLTPSYRRLIELRFINELSYEEIAELLGIPIGTVSTQIHRARKRLLKLMGE